MAKRVIMTKGSRQAIGQATGQQERSLPTTINKKHDRTFESSKSLHRRMLKTALRGEYTFAELQKILK